MAAAGMDAARDMDRMYRHQRHVYDLTRRYYLLGREALLAGLDPPAWSSILEIGCGTGRNLVQVARRYPQATLYGFDVSSAMLETAASSLVSSGLTARIRLAQADATRFDPGHAFGKPAFDRVFISYALSMIPAWNEVLDRAWDCVAGGGSLHVVDFGQQERLPRWFRLALFAWLGRFGVEPRADLPAALDATARDPGAELRFDSLFRGYAWHAVLRKA